MISFNGLCDPFTRYDHVVERTRRFFPISLILIEEITPFQVAPEGFLEGDPGISAPNVVA